ncbi:alpha/beta hydrolase [Asanoa sp. WMMD1127]|uniref:alpha/beta hydrolase n=1 Tax=Asanoa sp. WMMD1127 TaxID=3016107 RepID=UPI00241697AC|nr:alpha/beta hydrolase [Asanoa sp. WMMD1127]MDG4823706.1 alpha/beta hydrolase [Asanoa sp. WMMD1127]
MDDVAALRAGARSRAAARTPGPPMPTQDRVLGGVPVRVYQPDATPVVVYLHGGGFVMGDLDTHDPQVRRLAAATGASVVAVDYRRAPEHPWPAAVDDAVSVLTALSGGPLAVAGDSSGGMLAALAALRVPGLRAQLLVCPNADPTLSSPSVVSEADNGFLDPAVLREWISWWLPSPADRSHVNLLRADLAGQPPALVVTAEHDPLRDEGEAYAARLAAAGVPVRQWREPGLRHDFPTMRDTDPAAAAAEDRFLAAARELLA